jgi:hypothetical protein
MVVCHVCCSSALLTPHPRLLRLLVVVVGRARGRHSTAAASMLHARPTPLPPHGSLLLLLLLEVVGCGALVTLRCAGVTW